MKAHRLCCRNRSETDGSRIVFWEVRNYRDHCTVVAVIHGPPIFYMFLWLFGEADFLLFFHRVRYAHIMVCGHDARNAGIGNNGVRARCPQCGHR